MDRQQEVDHLAQRRGQDQKWVQIQKKTFTRWCNTFLKERMLKVEDLQTDFKDGIQLIQLLEIISSKQVHGGRWNKKPRIRPQFMENNQFALQFLQSEGIKLVNIGNEDIVDGNLKIILGLIWTIILRYQINLSEGGSARGDLLKWVRSKIPAYNIMNFATDWNDGKAICALVDALQPGKCPNHADLDESKALENAILGTDLGEEHFGIPKILDAEDMISEDLDELSCMTYISYFRDWEGNQTGLRAEEIVLKTAIAGNCRAFGPGVEHGVLAGVETSFTIEAINEKGTRVPCGGDHFDVTLVSPSGAQEKAEPVDNGDGTYGVTYTAKEAGKYEIPIILAQLNGQGKGGEPKEHIGGSPYSVDVLRNSADAGNTRAYGPGLEPGCKVGEPAPFVIKAVGSTGIKCDDGGDDIVVQVEGPGGPVKVDMKDNGDGTYNAAYHPIKAGEHTVTVKLDGDKDIQGSPFTIAIDPNATDANASNTVAYGPGVEGPVNTAEPAVFLVEIRNAAGEKCALPDADAPIDCWIVDADKNEVDADIKDNGDGTRTVTYQPTSVGPHVVNVVLRNRYEPTLYEDVKNSPFTVNVDQGTFAFNSFAFGPGLEDGIPHATKETEFTIQAVDRDGKKCIAGGVAWQVSVTGPSGDVASSVRDNGDGTYIVKYTPSERGDHTVAVSLKDTPIKDSPFSLSIKSASDASNTEAFGPGLEDGVRAEQPTEFTIQAKDHNGEPVKEGADAFVVKIDGPNGDVPHELTDNGDGTYGVKYEAKDVGTHTIAVTLDDEPIKNAPFKVEVQRNAPDAGQSRAFGPGLEPGIKVGEPAQFKIESVGPTGVACKEGGDSFTVAIEGPRGVVPCMLADNGDGTYDAVYNPIDAGEHTITVKLADDDIKNSPFKVAVEVQSENADASNTVAFGPGVEGPVDTAYPAIFTVETRNAAGERCTLSNADAPIVCKIVDPEGVDLESEIKDNLNGTRTVTYQAAKVGKHTVSVDLLNRYDQSKSDPIKGSPFAVDVKQGTFASNSYAFGPGLESNVPKATIETEFTIQAVDCDGQQCASGGTTFTVNIDGPVEKKIKATTIDNNDGTYTVKYTPEDQGEHKIGVTLKDTSAEDLHIKDSPFTIAIKSATDAANCTASGPGIGDRVHETQPVKFQIQAKDRDGEDIKEGGDPFVVKIDGPNGEVPAEVSDNGDGTYDVAYQPTAKGPHTVSVTLEDAPIKDAPFTVDVKSAVDPSKTTASGPGVDGPLEDTEEGLFTIQARDFEGNPVAAGGDPFDVTVNGPNGEIPADITDNGDGTYEVKYQPDEDGDYTVDVKLHNENIKDAPFKLDIGEGAAAAHTKVEAFSFIIQAFNKKGNPKAKGGAKFGVKISDATTGEPVLDELTSLDVKDRGTGKYRVMYKLPPGEFQIDCTVGGRSIKGSPWKQAGLGE